MRNTIEAKIDMNKLVELANHAVQLDRSYRKAEATLLLTTQALELALFALEAVEFVTAVHGQTCPWCHAGGYIRANIKHSETCKREIARHAVIEALGRMDEDHE